MVPDSVLLIETSIEANRLMSNGWMWGFVRRIADRNGLLPYNRKACFIRSFLDWDARTMQNPMVVRLEGASRSCGTLAGKVPLDGDVTRPTPIVRTGCDAGPGSVRVDGNV
jgi:hypothetical protein